jgi:membrane protein implicated in regulation of membrane protease activity
MAEVLGLPIPLLLTLAGITLLVGEALAPGAHFVVLGVALLVAGIVGFVVGPAATPLVLAAVVLGAGGVTLWAYRHFDFYGGKGSGTVQDSSSLVGKEGEVTERVTATSGRVRLVNGGFDPVYSARALDDEIAEGETVIVTDPGGGSVLTVAALDSAVDDIDRELARERERATQGEAEDGDDAGSLDVEDDVEADRPRDTEPEPE